MASGKCLENISKKPPPGNRYCPGSTCEELKVDIQQYCQSHNLGPDEPYATFANDGSGKCYCCCSCFAFGTPIEVEPELYKLIQSIKVGETVMATGPELAEWKPAAVTHTGGIAPEVEVDFMLLGQFRLANSELRLLIASADHLFLNGDPAGAMLIPFGTLRPGHQVRTADGGVATVVLTSYIQFSGGVRHIALGPWEPDQPLDGHLLNSNGLVTADLSVQLRYYSGEIADEMVHTEEVPVIGSSEFHAAYDTTAYTAFLNDPSQWPEGVRPVHTGLISVPRTALAYLTPAQARDVEESLGAQDLGNSMYLTQALYLCTVYRGFYKDLIFIVDWANLQCNAWFFRDNRQAYVVLSGGLLRVPGLMLNGLAIVLAHLVANSRGIKCTAEADWEGMRNELHEVWYDDLFFQMVEGGIPQIEAVFSRISEKNRQGNPDRLCADPGTDCRIKALWAGASLTKLPDCAVPPPAFAVTWAGAETAADVVVSFNKPYDVPSAGDPANYVFTPGGVATGVDQIPDRPESVRLVVDGLEAGTQYTVTVSHVYSATGKPLTQGHDSATFTAPEGS